MFSSKKCPTSELRVYQAVAEAAPVPGPDARHGRSQFSAAERFSKKPPCGSAWFMLLSAGHSSSTLLQTVMATNHDLVDAARRRVLSANRTLGLFQVFSSL